MLVSFFKKKEKIISFNKNIYSTSTKIISFSRNIYSTSTKLISFNKNIYSNSTKIISFNKNIYSTSTKNITLPRPSRPRHPGNFLPSSDAASLFETNHVVQWNTSRDNIFFCVAYGFFVLRNVHSQRVCLQEESLSCFLSAIELSAWPLFI